MAHFDMDEIRERQVLLEAVVSGGDFSKQFLVGMLNRMGMSGMKYGRVKDAYPHKVDAMASLKQRLEKYEETGNTEWLMDVANFAMIEYMYPRHPDAHFEATDSDQSPGRTRVSGYVNAKNNFGEQA